MERVPNVVTKHILIAGDSSFFREHLRPLIERHQAGKVCEAEDGVQASGLTLPVGWKQCWAVCPDKA